MLLSCFSREKRDLIPRTLFDFISGDTGRLSGLLWGVSGEG
jgi:hypothetical protein